MLLDDTDTPRALSLVLQLVMRAACTRWLNETSEALDESLVLLTVHVQGVRDLSGLEGLRAKISAMMRRQMATLNQKYLDQSDSVV